jgi:hypothetical protein
MREWETILEHGALMAAGAAIAGILLWWKGWRDRKSIKNDGDHELARARSEAERIVKNSQLEAKEQALRIMEQTEQAFAARRSERSELERRLTERETLINNQLERIVEAEKTLDEQKRALKTKVEESRAGKADAPVFGIPGRTGCKGRKGDSAKENRAGDLPRSPGDCAKYY